MRKATYQNMHTALANALGDLSILAGDCLGPKDASWQDVAGTAAVNLRALASLLEAARQGHAEAGLVFPSPAEVLEANEEANRLDFNPEHSY